MEFRMLEGRWIFDSHWNLSELDTAMLRKGADDGLWAVCCGGVWVDVVIQENDVEADVSQHDELKPTAAVLVLDNDNPCFVASMTACEQAGVPVEMLPVHEPAGKTPFDVFYATLTDEQVIAIATRACVDLPDSEIKRLVDRAFTVLSLADVIEVICEHLDGDGRAELLYALTE